ncbi:MAG: hypothetical protein LBS68_03665 [Puniceicoccales bacterium]|jgi:hypothetical protein|nr:hypothetical protein [Puniceicoccales bacterium]
MLDTESRDFFPIENLQTGQPPKKPEATSPSKLHGVRVVLFVVALLGTAVSTTLLFLSVAPMVGAAAAVAGAAALFLMGKFYCFKPLSPSEKTPPPVIAKKLPPTGGGDSLPNQIEGSPAPTIEQVGDSCPGRDGISDTIGAKNFPPQENEDSPPQDIGAPASQGGELHDSEEVADSPPSVKEIPSPTNTESPPPIAKCADIKFTEISPSRATELMGNFESTFRVEIGAGNKNAINKSKQPCKRLDPGQAKEFLGQHLQRDDDSMREKRKFAAELSEKFFDGAFRKEYDSYKEKLKSSSLMLGDIRRIGSHKLKPVFAKEGLLADTFRTTFPQEDTAQKVVEVIYESYDTDTMRLRALRFFLGCCANGFSFEVTLAAVPHTKGPEICLPGEFGTQSRFSAVNFNADTTVTITSWIVCKDSNATISKGVFDKDSFLYTAMQCTIGTPFIKDKPSEFPDKWEEEKRDKKPLSPIGVAVNGAAMIWRKTEMVDEKRTPHES